MQLALMQIGRDSELIGIKMVRCQEAVPQSCYASFFADNAQ